jgi:hypothetical protein
MALVLADRVKETTTTTGTGTYTLAGAVSGFQSFSVIGNGNTTYYAAADSTSWEVGIGTYTSSGTTLARTTILASSNSNNPVNWGAGTKDIFVTYPAGKSVYVNESGELVIGATLLTGTLSLADNTVNRPLLQDYAVEGSAIGNTGGTRTLDLTVANFFSATLNQACTFTFSNPPASGKFGCFVLELTNGGAFTINWPGTVDWPGGTAPTLTVSGKDQLVFTTRDAGTNWFGFVAGYDIKSP